MNFEQRSRAYHPNAGRNTQHLFDLINSQRSRIFFRIDEKVIQTCLLDSVGHAVCGVQIDAAKDVDSEFSQMTMLFANSIWRFVLLQVAPDVMNFFGIKVFYPKAATYFGKLLRQLLEDHKQNKKYDNMMGVHLKVQEEMEKKKAEIIASGEEYFPITDEMIISSCMQFFLDGVISIGSMLEVAVFHLAQNPEIQEKAFEEIQSVLGDRLTAPDGSNEIKDLPQFTETDIMEMKYIEQIFSEASRLGAFPFANRMCTKDYKLPDMDLVIPKGTPVHIPILGFHMDPKLFPNPEKFDPERFSAVNKGNIVTGSFIPFGLGPRMCLGQNYIKMEGRCFLANLIRSFRIFPSNKTVESFEWEIEGPKLKGGLYVKLEKREN